jgi:3-phenylpropionate/trans-cinnamate dioxygenase ferredoxin subunit
MDENAYRRVASLGDLPEGTPVAVELEGGEAICLVHVAGEVFACADRCSHADFPMSDGDMVDDHVIECPLHGAQFDVRTGAVLEEPATEPLETFRVRVDGDDVLVLPRRPSD